MHLYPKNTMTHWTSKSSILIWLLCTTSSL